MKLLSYKIDKIQVDQVGILHNQSIFNLNDCFNNNSLLEIIQIGSSRYKDARSNTLVKYRPDQVMA